MLSSSPLHHRTPERIRRWCRHRWPPRPGPRPASPGFTGKACNRRTLPSAVPILVGVLCTWLFVHFFELIIRLCSWARCTPAFSVANFALIPGGSLIEVGGGGPYFDPLAASTAGGTGATGVLSRRLCPRCCFIALARRRHRRGIRLGCRIGLLGHTEGTGPPTLPDWHLPPAKGSRVACRRLPPGTLAGRFGSILVGLLVPLQRCAPAAGLATEHPLPAAAAGRAGRSPAASPCFVLAAAACCCSAC
ncbi:hypothetical protein ACPA9J_04465 [Pseudomonas aeruginosa]